MMNLIKKYQVDIVGALAILFILTIMIFAPDPVDHEIEKSNTDLTVTEACDQLVEQMYAACDDIYTMIENEEIVYDSEVGDFVWNEEAQ